jgi:hypothetical protein
MGAGWGGGVGLETAFLTGAGFFFSGSGAGAGAAATGGGGACTVRLLTTVRIPATCAASDAASWRAASLLTVPLRVATPFWTETWMGSELSALSPEIRLWRAELMLASSGVGVELLHPAMPRANARVEAAMREREVEPRWRFIRVLFRTAMLLLRTL